MGKSGSPVTGYRYYFGLLLGMCRGPIDELLRIKVGDVAVWGGDTDLSLPLDPDAIKRGDSGKYPYAQLTLTDTGTTFINAAAAFGGDTQEGGIKGPLYFLNGHPDQVCPTSLSLLLGGTADLTKGNVPSFRGVALAYFNGTICSNNPYPKTWKMRIRRALRGWDGDVWYPATAIIWMMSDTAQFGADAQGIYAKRKTYDFYPTGFTYFATDIQILYTIISTASYDANNKQINAVWDSGTVVGNNTIRAMNPAHIVYEAATNRDWGRGLPRSMIDECSFSDSADQLFDEGFGLCLKYNRQSELGEFVQEVVNHCAGSLYIDRGTGLLTFRLIREGYTVSELPVFDYTSGILSVEDDSASSTDTWYNEQIVTYHDQIEDKDRSTRVQNLGSIQALDAIYSNTTSYIGIPTYNLAARVAVRDLKSSAAGLKRFKFKMDRRAWKIAPAGVFVINLPDRGVENMVLRATVIEDGTLADGTMTITALQDVFGLPDAGYVRESFSTWQPPDTSLYFAAVRLAYEASYRDVVRLLTGGATIADTAGAIVTAAMRPSALSLNYSLATYDAAAVGTPAATGGGDWCPAGQLKAALAPLDTLVSFSLLTGFGNVEVGEAGMIGAEVVRVDAIDTTANTITVARGCVDTIPAPHAAGTWLFFNDGVEGKDGVAYEAGETVDVKVLTRTSQSLLAVADAPPDAVVMAQRHFRPFPPANVQYNGLTFDRNTSVDGDVAFTWAHRDRLLEQDQLVGHLEASVGPEPGTTYVMRVYNGATLLREVDGITDPDWTYTAALATADGAAGYALTFRLTSSRAGIESLQPYVIMLSLLSDGSDGTVYGYGESYGESYGGLTDAATVNPDPVAPGYGQSYGYTYGGSS